MAIQRFPDLAIVVLALASAGCDLGGIPRDKAIEIATHLHPASVLSAERGPLGRFASPGTLPDQPRSREVWAIRIEGRFPLECPYHPGLANCPPDATTMLVVLDFLTGEFVFSETPAP
jgi:hypothetical protein